MKYFASLRILCITDVGRRGSNITNPKICWTLSKWHQKPAIYGPKQDDGHPCPCCYRSQACVDGGFFGLIFVFGLYLYSRMQVKWKNHGGEGKGEREKKEPPQLTPWDFWNVPSSLVKEGIWLTRDVTCLEVWQLSKTTVMHQQFVVYMNVFFYSALCSFDI